MEAEAQFIAERKKNHSSSSRRKEEGTGMALNSEEIPILCLLLKQPNKGQINVFALDFNGKNPKMSVVSTLEPRQHHCRVGYASVGSKLYVVGGEFMKEEGRFPKDVHVCKFGKDPVGGGITCHWEDGPRLNGGKPGPMVVTVKGKIYALAGWTNFLCETDEWSEKAYPPFEVLDPESDQGWKALSSPPFVSRYDADGPWISAHTVIENTIYLRLLDSNAVCNSDMVLYSYNTILDNWYVHRYNVGSSAPAAIKCGEDLIAENLRLSEWFGRADVVNNRLYLCRLDLWSKGTKAFAFDLASKKNETTVKHKCNYCDEDEDEEEEEEEEEVEDVVILPVHGLNHLTDSIPNKRPNTTGFVAHLRDNLFCLVTSYPHPRKDVKGRRSFGPYLHLIAFTVNQKGGNSRSSEKPPSLIAYSSSPRIRKPPTLIKHCLHAQILTSIMSPLDSRVEQLPHWCKIQT